LFFFFFDDFSFTFFFLDHSAERPSVFSPKKPKSPAITLFDPTDKDQDTVFPAPRPFCFSPFLFSDKSLQLM